MTKHIIRIAHPWIRRPLLVLVFPFSFAQICLVALWHRPRTLLEGGFYDLAWRCFWSAWDGAFVP